MYAIMIVEDEELIRQGLTSLVDYEQFGMAKSRGMIIRNYEMQSGN